MARRALLVALLALLLAMAVSAAERSEPRFRSVQAACSEATKLRKTSALLWQGFFGFAGAGAIYTGHAGLAVASMASSTLIILGFVLSNMLFGTKPTSEEEKEKMKELLTPKEVKEARERSSSIVGNMLMVGFALVGILWVLGEVAIVADWMLPADGCGWGLQG